MKSAAVIGASRNRDKFGNKALRAYQAAGYQVFPVHPQEPEIEGVPAFASIGQVPRRPDIVSVYLPPQVLLPLLEDVAGRGCDELWLNPGTESPDVLAEAERLGLKVVQACSIVGLGLGPADFP